MSERDATGVPGSLTPEEQAWDVLPGWIKNAWVAAIHAAVADRECSMLAALGAPTAETLHDWLVRQQAEANRLREAAVATEREACAKVADREWCCTCLDNSRCCKGCIKNIAANHIAAVIRSRS